MSALIQSTEAEVIYNWNLSRDFPPLPENQVERVHLLHTIADILTEETPIVYLEGNDGSGTSTILAQFCQENPLNSFSLFIKPVSKFAYSVDLLRSKLFEQIYWFIESKTFDKDTVDNSLYTSYLQKLRRSKKAKIFYFVVDGMHQIPNEDQLSIEQIIKEVLPIGAGANFRFLITGKQSILGQHTKRVHSKTYQLASFSASEVTKFFSDVPLTDSEVSEIRKLCQGNPGRLASVKRLINSSMPLAEILNSEPSKYLEFIKLEFGALNTLEENQRLIIAILAFGKRPLLESELIKLSSSSEDEMTYIKSQCLFLQYDSSSGIIEFLSDSHRRFAEKQLSSYQKQAFELQVSYLTANPNSQTALRFLPTYYQSLGQQQAIVDLLSTEHYIHLLESTESLVSLKNRAELGLKSATSLKQVANVFKFSLQKSFFTAVTNQDGFESEISALVTLHQPDVALALANSAVSKEDRLALLATYAKKVIQKNETLDTELAATIRQLTDEIDFAECGDKSVDIASDILFFDPDLAISIVEKARDSSKNGRDAAFAQLSITASLNNSTSNRSAISVEDKAIQKISDEALQKMTSSVSVILSKYSVTELKNTVEGMKAKHRLFFLKSYISNHYQNPEILDVVEYTLDFLIADTIYLPKSRDLAELVRPLPYCLLDLDRLKKIVVRFDSQLGLVQNLAISKDLVVFHMNIARAEIHFDEAAALNRIEQIYYEITEIKNLETIMECYAVLLHLLMQIDRKFKLEENYHYIEIVQADLKQTISEVLKQTANHYSIAKGLLNVLSESDPAYAIQLASELNTLERRDRGYRLITRILASKPFQPLRAEKLIEALNKIENPTKRVDAIINIINVFELNADKGSWINTAINLKNYLDEPEPRLAYSIKLLDLLFETGNSPSLKEFIDEFEFLVEGVDSKIEIVDLYFKSVPPIAKIDATIARKFYDKGNEIKKNLKFNSAITLEIFQTNLSLLFRAMSPVMKYESNWEDWLFRLNRLIEMLPSAYLQAAYYNELAVRAWCVDKTEICKFIVKRYCQPLLEAFKTSAPHLHKQLKTRMFSAFHCNHAETAFQLLSDVYLEDKDDALYEAATIRLRRLPANAPYHLPESDVFKISKEDAYDILGILSHLQTDSAINGLIDVLINSILDKVNKSSFTAQQKTDIAQRLMQIIMTKLPDPKNISHEGFKISSLAKIYQMEDTQYSSWQKLLNDVESISNIADRGYVYMHIAICMQSRYSSDKSKFLNKALKLIYTIPSITDKLARLQSFSRLASKIVRSDVQDALKRSILLTLELDDTAAVMAHQREILNLADAIDPKFADELIGLLDDDPARSYAKAAMKISAAQIKSKKDFANVKEVNEAVAVDKEFLSESSWENLAALLANKLETKNEDVMTEYISAASKFSLDESYPILSWYLENSIKRYANLNDYGKKILPLTEVLFVTTEMAGTIIANSNNVTQIFSEQKPQTDGIIVLPKSRDEAINFIRLWLRESAEDYIIYCDPYFGPDDIEFLRLVLAECPSLKLTILTSKKALQDKRALNVEAFIEAWDAAIAQDPPESEIIAIDSVDNNPKAGIHDRWILTRHSGLRVGTSFNSLGIDKLSEISHLDMIKLEALTTELKKYLEKTRYISGAKVNYTTFNL